MASTSTSDMDGGAPPPSYGTVFTNAKAGMEEVDQERIKRIVYEMSKDRPHFKNEERKMQQTEERVRKMRVQAAALSAADLARRTAAMDGKVTELEATRELTRTWLHVDMDAFFASVEELDDPMLRGRPFAVGGLGMISTASYAARKFGVRSAMPGFIALKLCPDLVFVPGSFDKYRAAADRTRVIFQCYDPAFQAASLDEAALDITDFCNDHMMTGGEVAEELRRRVRTETELTCSCGVAPNRTLAKVCSDRNKPDGQFCLEATRDGVMRFVGDLSIRKVPGIGRVTEHVLKAFGVERCADLIAKRGLLAALFSSASVDFFLQCGLGLGATQHSEPLAEGEVGRKGIGCERTFRAMSARGELEARCAELAEQLASDMAEEGLKGRTLTLKLKATSFELRTRAVTLDHHIHTAEDILSTSLKLLRAELPIEIRLMGLRMSNFYEEPKREPGQASLEQLLHRRQAKAAGSAAVGAANGGDGGVAWDEPQQRRHGGGDGDEEVVHSSQVLSAGDILELTLREWHDVPGNSDGGLAAAAEVGGLSLPPSLAVSPATAARYAAKAGAGNAGPPELRLPPTLLDLAVHQAAQQGCAATQQQSEPEQQQQQQQQPWQPGSAWGSWACEGCTFINPKTSGWCEMCGTSCSGRRPPPATAPAAGLSAGGSRGKGKKRSFAAGSILNFCVPKGKGAQHAPEREAQRQETPCSTAEQQQQLRHGPGKARVPASGQQAAEPSPSPLGAHHADAASSPLQPGEDVVECPVCGEWVRGTEYQSHCDWHTAVELQREEGVARGQVGVDPGPVPRSCNLPALPKKPRR